MSYISAKKARELAEASRIVFNRNLKKVEEAIKDSAKQNQYSVDVKIEPMSGFLHQEFVETLKFRGFKTDNHSTNIGVFW